MVLEIDTSLSERCGWRNRSWRRRITMSLNEARPLLSRLLSLIPCRLGCSDYMRQISRMGSRSLHSDLSVNTIPAQKSAFYAQRNGHETIVNFYKPGSCYLNNNSLYKLSTKCLFFFLFLKSLRVETGGRATNVIHDRIHLTEGTTSADVISWQNKIKAKQENIGKLLKHHI